MYLLGVYYYVRNYNGLRNVKYIVVEVVYCIILEDIKK